MTPPGELDKMKKRAIILRNLAGALLTAYIIMVTAVLMYDGYTGTQTRRDLLDCVEPSGKCFKEGQKRTGQVVASLNDVTVAAAVCSEADEVRREPDMARRIMLVKRCIQENMEAD